MTVVVGIRFKDSGKTYFFDPRDLELQPGEMVIVETVRGPELAKVAYERRDVPESELVGELKPVVRKAESADFERMYLLHARHEEVLARCAEKVREHSLPMNLVKAEYSFDGSRLTFYFTSEKRVDFRMLVRDLARTFKSRIELRQIGPRDEAKLLGGIGPCGRLLCCATFLPDYARVSIKMAKDQDLPLNPAKISGVCGRLLCCLSYEHEQYIEMRAELPRRGTWVKTPDGPGEVVAVNVLKRTVTVQLAGSGMLESYTPEQIQEATAHVSAVARSRAEEGITPTPYTEQDLADEYADPAITGGDLRHDTVDNHEILDTLAWLEQGAASPDTYDDEETPPLRPPSTNAARQARDIAGLAELLGRADAPKSPQAPAHAAADEEQSNRSSRKRSRGRRSHNRRAEQSGSGPQQSATPSAKEQPGRTTGAQPANSGPPPQQTSRRRKPRRKGKSEHEQS